MRASRTALVLFALVLAASPGVAGACAALFSPEGQVRQSAQRIIFAVDQAAGMVEAYVAVNYTGAAKDFAWVVPLPSNPKVEVIQRDTFVRLENATTPRFKFPAKTCLTPSIGLGASPPGSAGGVNIYQQGQVGPYDFSVVGGPDTSKLSDWLRQNGYRVTPAMEPLIASYSDAGMLFLAMKLRGGQDVRDITPVKMTFQATKAMIPLRLAAVGAEPNTELLVWVFASSQVIPENMERVVIPNEAITIEDFRSERSNYDTLLDQALTQTAGRGLVTEVAEPTRALSKLSDPVIADLRTRFPYITRLHGRFSPEQMTIDPTFIPRNGLPDLPTGHNFSDRVSPYDCMRGEVLPANEQIVLARSIQGTWITNRWLLGYCLVPLLALLGLATLVVQRRRRRRPSQ